VSTKSDTLDISGPLTESMDQSIGEVTTVMGAMITELMRRSLRGGVAKIGEELQSVVLDKVDTAVAQRVPEVERAAAAVAEQTAQLAAAKVAAEEVYALDRKTGEAARQLASQIEDVGRKAHGAVEEKAQALTGRIDEVDRRAGEATRQTAEHLSGRIVETEKRVTEMTQAEIDQRLLKVMEKSREAAAVLKTRIKSLEDLSEGLGQQLRQGLDRLGQSLSHGVESCQSRLKDEVSALRKVNEALEARVKVLEQPKGFFALLSRWFGRRKGKGKEKEIGVAGA
jgi:hypothetical protein